MRTLGAIWTQCSHRTRFGPSAPSRRSLDGHGSAAPGPAIVSWNCEATGPNAARMVTASVSAYHIPVDCSAADEKMYFADPVFRVLFEDP